MEEWGSKQESEKREPEKGEAATDEGEDRKIEEKSVYILVSLKSKIKHT